MGRVSLADVAGLSREHFDLKPVTGLPQVEIEITLLRLVDNRGVGAGTDSEVQPFRAGDNVFTRLA